MNSLLLRASARFYSRHPWQLVLALAGICLGVAVYVGVDLANDSSRRAFELSSQLIRGTTTHRLLPVGRELDERVFRDLVLSYGASAAPIVESPVSIAEFGDREFDLLGVDPLAESGFRQFAAFAPRGANGLVRLITEPATVLVSKSLLDDYGVEVGDTVTVSIAGGRHAVEIVGTINDAGVAPDATPPIVADISTAQELSGQIGILSRIDLVLTDSQAEKLESDPPIGTVLVTAAGQDDAFSELTRAFQTNIRALGLLALVVGMFLIYATIYFTVVQRRASMGILRALGVTKWEIFRTILAEAFAIGLVGSVAGLLLGQWLAEMLIDMVLSTIGDFYFSSRVEAAAPSPLIFAQGLVLGIVASVIAALGPVREAMGVSPTAAIQRSSVEKRALESARWYAVAALPVILAAGLLLVLEPRSLLWAFIGIFLFLIAGALLTPFSTTLLVRSFEPLARRFFGLSSVLALRNVNTHMSRIAVATAALSVAVATVIGVGLMIASFRGSVIDWLDTTLTADIYLTLDARPSSNAQTQIDSILGIAGVASVSRTAFARLPTSSGALSVRGVESGTNGWGLDIVDGDPAQAIAELGSGGILLSEPTAYKRSLARGEMLTLPTATGSHDFKIAGVYRDYNASAGAAVVDMRYFRQHWREFGVSGVGVFVAPGADKESIARQISDELDLPAGARIRTTEAIEELSLTVFDRTFQITEVLRILAAIVAFLGILSALLAIQLERGRELAVLRSMGFSPRKLCSLILTETGILGIAAGLLAVPIGCVLAALLVYVINRRSFGWTMDMVIAPEPLLFGILLAASAALLAGLIPSIRAASGKLSAALRDE